MRSLMLLSLFLLAVAIGPAPDCRASGFCLSSRCPSDEFCGPNCTCLRTEPMKGICVLR